MKTRTVLATLTMLAVIALAMAGRGTVLVIQSYHPSLDWTRLTDLGIADVLGSSHDVHTVHMDTKRLPGSAFEHQAELAWAEYVRLKPSLVLLGDDDALRLVGPRLANTGTPFVYFGINNNPRNYFKTLPPTMAGLLERTPVVPWLRHLTIILPSARRALILCDNSVTSEAIIADVFQKRSVLRVNGLTVERRLARDWDDWRHTVRAGDHDLLLTPTFHAVRNKQGETVDWREVIVWTSANSPVPVFSNQDYTVHDQGVVGAFALHGENHGRLAATMALDILNGAKSPRDINHKTDLDGRFYFNQMQLERHGIALPAGIRDAAIFR